jgi:lipopolysaccharide/colanic/teichoic acid biosynthesis glycosyltransferase
MSVILVIASLAGVWILRQILTALIGQQIRGSVPDYTSAKAKAAAKLLPDELAESYLEDWLAELDALRDKPLSALRFAGGLSRAARTIAASAGCPAPPRRPSRVPTRLLDFAFTSTMLFVLSPMLVAISLAIRLTTSSRVLARRAYLGKEGVPFHQLRFSTVLLDGERLGRPTAVGRVLRRLSLDELPLLVAVLRGEMAIIGPPAVPIDRATNPLVLAKPPQVRPGIVGWEMLARIGAVELTIDDARDRDLQRRPMQDAALMLTVLWWLFVGMPGD